MVKCDCGTYFLVAFFNGECPTCGKKYPVTNRDRILKEASIEVCKKINNKNI